MISTAIKTSQNEVPGSHFPILRAINGPATVQVHSMGALKDRNKATTKLRIFTVRIVELAVSLALLAGMAQSIATLL